MDELDVLKLVAARLDSAGIRYMVTGSMAMNFYAQPRMTRDIDIVVELAGGDADRFVALFAADFERWASDLSVSDLLAEVRQ